ncbi:MAG: PBP1A family penicillin-binding protein [Oscillospiraceae bacterium]|jgi:penicillin-binding protein 1A|nr:PBP1A family penicillin-binding protein [Oscillospiraceae bacterium]
MNKLNIKQLKTLKIGVDTTAGIIALILRAALAVVLIAVTTMVFFACIFAVYVKTNLSNGLELSLEDFSQSISSIIYTNDPDTGEVIELATVESAEYRIWLEYDEIPIDVEHALVAIEDQRFYRHYGVDWYRTAGAFVTMFLAGEGTFGGSTITQQLIKNLTGNDEVTIQRKLSEIFSALAFERKYSKDEILQWYLNKVYFGKRAYGIAAAADMYFGKDVAELSVAEIASLIAIPNNPSIFNPYTHPENNKKRQRTILSEMYRQGYIETAEEYEAAKAEELVFHQGKNTVNNQQIYTWFEEAVIDEVTADLMELRGINKTTAGMLLSSGGYRIYATVNPKVQAAIDEVYEDIESLPKTTGTKKQLQSSIVVVDPHTGYIAGLSGGVGEKTGNRILNRATTDLGRRPAGSSIKPIAVYGPAMEAGLITPETKFDDSPDAVLTGRTDGWLPKNDDLAYLGLMDIRTAVVKSRNVIAAQVLDKLTPAVSFRFVTEKLGMELLPADEDYAPLSIGQLTLGTTAKEMASAYTIFDNNGIRVEAVTYTTIYDRVGNLVFENKPRQTVAISETTAYWMTSILHDAATVGTGSEANLGSMPTAGKTGTTGDNKDRWFCGYTPYYVAAVWTGYDQPEKISMSKRGNPASQLWKRVMAKIHADLPVKQFSVPPNIYQPPVPGIKEVGYTVKYQTESGTIFYDETKTAVAGTTLEITAPTFDRFEIVGDKSQTLIVNENEDRNTIIFIYRIITQTPTPEITPTPTPAITPPEPATPTP